MSYSRYPVKPISAHAGIGLRSHHYKNVINSRPKIGWFEVHSENYFGKGGKPHYYLDLVRQDYPLSFHGVGLSLGSSNAVCFRHLDKLKNLIERFSPALISEHLSWSSTDGYHLNDLLPLPFTEEALEFFIERINQVQDYLNRTILIENISSYLEYAHSTMPEYEFMSLLTNHTGCGILLDVNNLYINSINHGWNAHEYLQNIPKGAVQEIHLAGHTVNQFVDGSILIDTHDKPITAAVWELYSDAIQCVGPKPTLIEWDKDLPEFSVLLDEAKKADKILEASAIVTA